MHLSIADVAEILPFFWATGRWNFVRGKFQTINGGLLHIFAVDPYDFEAQMWQFSLGYVKLMCSLGNWRNRTG